MPKKKVKQDSALLNLPFELFTLIVEFLDAKARAAVSKTCYSLYIASKTPREKEAAQQLLTYVLHGDADNAERMFKANPRLLFIDATAKEYAAGIDEDGKAVYRVVKGSPLRAIYGTLDTDLLNKAKRYFDNVNDFKVNEFAQAKTGWQLAEEQFYQQFPDGKVAYPASTYDFSELVTVITEDTELVETGNPNDDTKKALVKFNNDFMPKVITEGHHFNMNELIKAMSVYDGHWAAWNGEQLTLFWCQIVGYLQRLVTANDAQHLCDPDLNLTLARKKALTRAFVVHNYDTNSPVSYFPLNVDSHQSLGRDFALIKYGDDSPFHLCRLAHRASLWSVVVENICKAKATDFDTFKRELDQPAGRAEERERPSTRCIIL